MKIHVLPGDSTAEEFRNSGLDGEVVVCRECLIEGDLRSADLDDFWKVRAAYILRTYGGSLQSYIENVAAEFEKLSDLRAGSEVNLWFEYELFCQANMWFCLYLLRHSPARIFRVAPIVHDATEIWRGFGRLTGQELRKCFDGRFEFQRDDRRLGFELWNAYRTGDFKTLNKLAATQRACLPYLREAVGAATNIDSVPKKILAEIEVEGISGFSDIFEEFSKRAGVYGFGDAQVKRLLAVE